MATRSEIERSELAPLPGQPEIVPLPDSGPVVIPGGGLLSEAVYARVDADLLIELADGTRLIVPNYFGSEMPPPLATDAGVHIGSDVVSALAGIDAAETPTVAAATAPIGRIETLSGDVEIVRADGAVLEAEVGTLVSRGDRIETGTDGNAGLLFADESTFSVGHYAKATFDELVFDPDSGAQHATFIVQQGTFSFSGGGISQTDGAFVIKTPAATISVDGASGAGRVESDGGTMVTYLRADDVGPGALRVENPAGAEVLDSSYEALIVDDYFTRPSGVLRLGPRDATEHFGDAVMALPDAHAMMPATLLSQQRGADPASRALAEHGEEEGFERETDDGSGLGEAVQVDRDTAFEIAARKAAIAAAARDAADEALRDASAAETAARMQAADAGADANEKLTEAEALRRQALDILEESERRDRAFEDSIRETERATQAEDDAARAVAETDLAEAQAAERLAAAEEAVRRALEEAERARNEALQILEEAKQKEAAFAEAQRAAQAAQEAEEARALAVAEADAAEEAAAAALRAAEAAAAAAARDAEAAERVAQEAGTAAEVVEKVVERELAAIDPDLLKPPEADDPSATRGDWITNTNASMNVARASLDAGEAAAREAYREALREGSSIEEALERAIVAAEAYGGARAADQVIAAGPDGLIDADESEDSGTLIAGGGGGGYTGDAGTTAAIGSDVLIGGAGGDALAGGGGGSYGGIDGLFGFGFTFTPIVLNLSTRADDDDDRDDPVTLTATVTSADTLTGTSLADFLVGDDTTSTIGAREGADFVYGDTPTNLLSGTHNISNTLTNPTFAASGGDDLISGGAGDDSLWGGAGADTIYGDVPDDTSAFGISLGSAGNGADDIYGGDGNDTIYGNGGADTLNGEGGDDTFMLGDDDGANDVVRGGDAGSDSGSDTVDYSGAGASVSIDLAAGTATGANTGTDTLDGIEYAVGTDHNDTISGSADANSLSGGGGADTLSGLGGADNIFGYAGDDVLIGGEGVDNLTGGTGADEFRFEGGSGADALAKATSLGTDLINDYNASENDLFMLSDGDFSLGNAGTLTDGVNYFEADSTTISGAAQNLSGGVANAGIVIIGSASGGDDAQIWYTDDASAMTDSNSYQIATVSGADRSAIDAGDFNLKN
ncbi:MAG: FecR domain-containing protein [Rhodospirillales bacterium]|nr:FecR domain-containing protein [Rhodospirillales bacterium]MBO6787602.1 FecR domain-containing protein [Rhodospirillales bacterium]